LCLISRQPAVVQVIASTAMFELELLGQFAWDMG
jgi:hypothetical protein